MSVILCTMIKKLRLCFQAVLKSLICISIQQLACAIRALMLSSCEGPQGAGCLRLPPSASRKPWELGFRMPLHLGTAAAAGCGFSAGTFTNGHSLAKPSGRRVWCLWAEHPHPTGTNILSVCEEQTGEKDLQEVLVLVQKWLTEGDKALYVALRCAGPVVSCSRGCRGRGRAAWGVC